MQEEQGAPVLVAGRPPRRRRAGPMRSMARRRPPERRGTATGGHVAGARGMTRVLHGHARRASHAGYVRPCLLQQCCQSAIVTRNGTPLVAAGLSPGNVHRHARSVLQNLPRRLSPSGPLSRSSLLISQVTRKRAAGAHVPRLLHQACVAWGTQAVASTTRRSKPEGPPSSCPSTRLAGRLLRQGEDSEVRCIQRRPSASGSAPSARLPAPSTAPLSRATRRPGSVSVGALLGREYGRSRDRLSFERAMRWV